MSCCGENAVKTETYDVSYIFPVDYSVTGFIARIRISESEGDAILLQVADTPNPNGSYTLCSGNVVRIVITVPDLVLLPNGDPISDPWVGVFEVDLIDTIGYTTRLDHGAFVLEKGV